MTVDAEEVARIGPGLLVLLGVFVDDDETRAARLAEKTLALRVFADAHSRSLQRGSAGGLPLAREQSQPGSAGGLPLGKGSARGSPLGKMNHSVMDVSGSLLVVSQFTLAADTSRGNRPGFGKAAPPERARSLYEHYVNTLRERWPQVATGVFGAEMQVTLTNDGPVTILLEL